MLFLIVYIGAIVVLFLFIIRRLELKMVNISFKLPISLNYLFIYIFIYFILTIISGNFFDLKYFLDSHIVSILNQESTYIVESIYYFNLIKIIQMIGQLEVLGGILFTEYSLSVLLISILLFLSRVASLALTLSFTSRIVANNFNKAFIVKEVFLTKRQEITFQILHINAFLKQSII